jgi:hypothetical protein
MRAAMRALRNVMAELDLTIGLTGVGSIPALVPGLAHPHLTYPLRRVCSCATHRGK